MKFRLAYIKYVLYLKNDPNFITSVNFSVNHDFRFPLHRRLQQRFIENDSFDFTCTR